jgi:BMFP domain-containing protein YqiC
MTEENVNSLSHSDMIRHTANNLQELLIKVSDHIDFLEKRVKELEDRANVSK